MKTNEALKHLPEITERILSFHPNRIILFGSAVAEGSDTVNDLDLLIVFNEQVKMRLKTIEILSSLRDIPVPVDIVVSSEERVKTRFPMVYSIEYQAIKKGRILYEAE
jgi:predicted nucleotidyltransferase